MSEKRYTQDLLYHPLRNALRSSEEDHEELIWTRRNVALSHHQFL